MFEYFTPTSPSQDTFHNPHIQRVTSTDLSASATHPHPSHISFKGELITNHEFTQWLCPFSCGLVTCHHTVHFSQLGLLETTGTGMLSVQWGSATCPQLHRPSPACSPCTCTGWGSSGTDTGTGTGMSSFNHGGFFRCKLLVLSCRASDIVPRLSSGLGEGRNHSQEGTRLIPDTVVLAGSSRARSSRLQVMGPKPCVG